MARIPGLRRTFRMVLRGETLERDLDEEIAFHLEMRTEDLIEQGLPPAAARQEALRRFGDVEKVTDACRTLGRKKEREMRRTELAADLRQDLAFAARQLAKSPGFTLVAALTLALGIGATTAIFSVVHAVLLRPLPFPEPDRVVQIWDAWRGVPGDVAPGNFESWRRESRSFERLAAGQDWSVNLTGDDHPERLVGRRVSADYFAVFGARPALGRLFLPEEDRPGAARVVVLSHRLWAGRFGSDPGILGRVLRLNDEPHAVVGVMPAAFDLTADSEALWVPIALTAERLANHDEHDLMVFGRLAPGVPLERARQEMTAIAAGLARRFPQTNTECGVEVHRFLDDLVGNYRPRLFLLLGAVGLVLLIACGNVSNLLLARGTVRARELAVRGALGAGRLRLVRQLLTESLVLALAGAAGGVLLAYWGVRALVAWSPDGVPRLEQAGLDPAVLGFAVGLAFLSSLVFGLVPALRGSARQPHAALKIGGRGAAGGPARDRVRGTLIVAEVAFALLLLVGAGLLIRSALLLQRVDPGFEPRGVLSLRLTLPAAQYPDAASAVRAFERVVREVEAVPGIRSAAVVPRVPLTPGQGIGNGLIPEGRPIEIASTIDTRFRLVSPDYFRTLGIPLRQGRAFDRRDGAEAPRVMIVNEKFARTAWPGESPLGKHVACCDAGPDGLPTWKEVVGVVGDVRADGLALEAPPEFYLPLGQEPAAAWDWLQRTLTVVAQVEGPSDGDPAAFVNPLREAVRRVDPGLPVYAVATLKERLAESLAQARFNTALLSALGAVGLALAAVGIYGVIAYFVRQRTPEIGLRIALGATGADVLGLVMRQALAPVLLGLGLGVAAAVAATRLLAGLLYGVAPTDAATFAAVVLGLFAAAALASYLPARRAARVDPTLALQST